MEAEESSELEDRDRADMDRWVPQEGKERVRWQWRCGGADSVERSLVAEGGIRGIHPAQRA
jgi:hypothetical protein